MILLRDLGFSDADFRHPVAVFSSGWGFQRVQC